MITLHPNYIFTNANPHLVESFVFAEKIDHISNVDFQAGRKRVRRNLFLLGNVSLIKRDERDRIDAVTPDDMGGIFSEYDPKACLSI